MFSTMCFAYEPDHCTFPTKTTQPPKYVKEIFDRLNQHASAKHIRLKVMPLVSINAMMCQNGVLEINQGMLNITKEDADMLAGVIAHEISHYTLKHIYSEPKTAEISKKREKQADLQGLIYMQKAGFNKCDYAKLFRKIVRIFGNQGGETHPTDLERAQYLSCKR